MGYSRDELLGRHYLDLVHPDYRESVRKYYGRQFTKRIHNTYKEFPSIAKDGSTVWLGQNVQLLSEEGRPVGFQAVARDVTKRVRNEILAQKLATVLEMVATGQSLPETLGRLCRAVEDLSRGLLCSVLVLEGSQLRHVAAPSLPPAFLVELERLGIVVGPMGGTCGTAAFIGKTVVAADIATDPRCVTYRGLALEHGILACWSAPILSSDRDVLGTFAVYYRVSRGPTPDETELVQQCRRMAGVAIERARSEMEVRRLNEELERRVQDRTAELEETNLLLQREIEERKRTERQLLEAKSLDSVGRLAGGVAHEFNNWLTVILLYAEQLIEDLPGEDPRRLGVDEIRRAADRASTLTRQLLAFGRKQVLQPKMLDLNALLTNFSGVVRSIMGPQVRLRMDQTPFLGTVKADPNQMEQVLVNLALNARDAMPSGGVFTLRTSNALVEAAGPAYESGIRPGEYVVLDAIDTGVGMDAKTREHIFEPFFTTKGVGQGSGLGLATVYGVIQQSGGQILVRSAPGRGTTFQIFLPLHVGDAAAIDGGDEPARPAVVPPRAMSAVVVDDDATIRRLVCQTLRKMGCDVTEAPDAHDALRLFESRAFDLLLTDVVMPNMGGRELAVKAARLRPGLKVLFISAYANMELDPAELASAAYGYVSKPFTKDSLAEAVASLVTGGSEGDALGAHAGQ